MPNRTIYMKAGDAQLWADTEDTAKRTGRSVSDLVAEGLRLVHAKRAHTVQEPRPAMVTAAPTPRQPVPDPFTAAVERREDESQLRDDVADYAGRVASLVRDAVNE